MTDLFFIKRNLFFLLVCTISMGNAEIAAPSEAAWSDVFAQAKGKVVQIFATGNEFDWFQPFKQGGQAGGSGSGFITSEQGDIYTNFHVVDGRDVLKIQHPLVWKEQFDVEFIGACPPYDLAHVRIKPAELARLKALLPDGKLDCFALGDSDTVVQGQEIMLVGYPLGEEHVKPSVGPISGRVPEEDFGGECFTTTASANPGNSGGPAINKEGIVIGVTVGVTNGADGINFLIPINRLKVIINELEDGKILDKALWGLHLGNTTPSTFVYLGNPADAGAYVTRVEIGSLAELAGIVKGDVIATINGLKVDRFGYVTVPWIASKVLYSDVLVRVPNGNVVDFTLYRNGELLKRCVVKTTDNPSKIKGYHIPFQDEPAYDVFCGMVFMELTLNHIGALIGVIRYHIKQGNVRAIKLLKEIVPYLDNDNRHKPRLIITHTFPETELSKNDIFSGFDCLVSTVNGIKVYTIQDFQEAVRNGSDTGHMVIETELGTKVALPLQDALAQEPKLAKKYRYTLSPLVQELQALK